MDCKNHPQIPAKRKCYYCKDPICSICQIKQSGHLFCSEECHKAYLNEDGNSAKPVSKEPDRLIPGTPHVDAAYSESFEPINIKNINLETFEAIQSVIENTDRDLKSYLKDLELIFESAGDENIADLKAFFEGKIELLDKSLDSFRKKTQETTRGLENIEESLLKIHNFDIEAYKEIKTLVKSGSDGFDGRLENIENGMAQTPSKLSKLFDALDNFSYSIEGNLSTLKSILEKQGENASQDIQSIRKTLQAELLEGSSAIKDQLKTSLSSIESSLVTSRDLEKELFKGNEDKMRNFLIEERKNLDGLLTDYGKRFILNLSSNKERISQSISRGSTEIKDFLDYQRIELLKAVSKLSGDLSDILSKGDAGLSRTGADISKSLAHSLEESRKDLSSNLDSFEEGLEEILDGNRRSIEEHLQSNRDVIKDDLSSALKEASSDIGHTINSANTQFQSYLSEHKDKVGQFISDNIEKQKEGLKREFLNNHELLGQALESFRSKLDASSLENLSGIKSTVQFQTSEIDKIIHRQIDEIETKLINATHAFEKLNKTTSNEFIGKLLASQEFFTQQMKAHLEKRESLLIDKFAALLIANKGNIEEVLAKSSIDLDEKIMGIKTETSRLLKTEVDKSMDVFNLNLSSMLGEIKDNLKKKVRAIPSKFSLSAPVKIILALILLFLFINPVVFYINSKWLNKSFDNKLADFAGKLENTEVKTAVIESVKTDSPSRIKNVRASLSIPDNYSSSSKFVTLKGSSKFGDFVLLSVNGKWSNINFIKNGSFSFENVALDQGANRIEITAFDKNGDRSLPDAKTLFYRKTSNKIYNLAYNISRGDIRNPNICITFDGGSNDKAAAYILDTLKAQGIRTTMFLTGTFIKDFPELTKRIVAEGHEVGNHSMSHPHFINDYGKGSQRTAYSRKKFEKELSRAADLFKRATGSEMAPYWRAPYGEINDEILSWAKNLGYTHVGWTTKEGKTMDTLDWVEMEESRLYRSADSIKAAILDFDDGVRGGANGSIILMHLGTNRKGDQPYSKLSEIIDGMRSRGYRFAKVSDLIKSYKRTKVAKE